eukprot:4902679-Amphidinium_carterae.1
MSQDGQNRSPGAFSCMPDDSKAQRAKCFREKTSSARVTNDPTLSAGSLAASHETEIPPKNSTSLTFRSKASVP